MTVTHTPTATTQAVAMLVLDRVMDAGGDFTANTVPDNTSVAALIVDIANEVQARVGLQVDTSLADFADLTVATGVAAQIELAFTDDDGQDAQSKYAQLEALYEKRLAALAGAEERIEQGGDVESIGVPYSQFSVPDTSSTRYPMTRAMEAW